MKKIFPLVLTPLFLSGCLMVPKTTISGTVNGQPFSLSCPKNVTLNGLEVTAETNKVSVKVQSLVTVMDPQVITTTGDAQTKLITGTIAASADAFGKVAGAAAAAAAGKP